jgi:hypothetical protein
MGGESVEKAKNRAVIAMFCIFILAFAAAMFIVPDKELSRAERRRLAQKPEADAESVFSGEFAQSFEEYLCDQFPAREQLRTLKSSFALYALRQLDVNGLYITGGTVVKEDTLDEKQVSLAVGKINSVREKYLSDCRVFYTVVPDKGYYAAEGSVYPHMDYDELFSILDSGLADMSYIDITGTLDLDSYYRTDSHWRQEKILQTARTLLDGMGAQHTDASYEEKSLYPFYGVYYGQAALPLQPDTIVYLESSATRAATVTSAESGEQEGIYIPENITNVDGYDVFLSGAQAIITIENPSADTDRELILFRDSYGSSIAPLLLEGYSKITLVDLRYISPMLLEDYITFGNQDVLFLYSTTIFNNGAVLRG